MTNPVIELIHQHGSVRNYKPDPVSREMVETIVTAGQRASTSSNMQLYSVVVTTDQGDKDQFQVVSGGQQHISEAPIFLTWCADLSRLDRVCRARGRVQQAGYVENFTLAVVDTALAAQNGALAAESMGLGFCYIGSIRNKPRDVIRLLDLPRLVFPLVGMTIGWPEAPPTIRPRLPLEAVLHWDRYQPENDHPHLEQYDQDMIATGIYEGRQVSPEDPLPTSEYGWQEHTSRQVSRVQRPHLREVLVDWGFELK